MADSKVIIKDLYPLVAKALDKNDKKFRDNIAKYFQDRHKELFDIAPYDRIYFNQRDLDALWASIGLTEQEVINVMKKSFFWNIAYNPQCAKEPYVEVLMMAIRYYLKAGKDKFAELTAIYLAFSGKFYASLHAGVAFPTVAPSKYKTVMDFVVNNMMSDKFDLKKSGSVFGAISSMCRTWLETYGKEIAGEVSDDRLGKILQQLRERERSFLMNIAKLFYEAWQNRSYLNYETDDLNPDSFHLTDNDAATAARYTQNTINYLTSNYVSLDICNKCKDANVKATEVKDIIESILGDNKNLPQVTRVINIIICDFLRTYPGKSLGSIDFVSYSIKSKPNTKDPMILEMRDTILKWLDENSPNYRKRRSRKATAASYYRSILLYFVLVINKIGRN